MAITRLEMGRGALTSYGIPCLQDRLPRSLLGLVLRSKGRCWTCLSVTPGYMDTEPEVWVLHPEVKLME